MIGSVSKSFTAAVVLRLQGQGRIALDSAVGHYVTGFPHGDQITVRQLLAHRSGLGNLFALPNYAAEARRYHTPAEVVNLIREQPLGFEPGSSFAYNNVNYSALAWLIEQVTNRSYVEAIDAALVRPLGLEHTLAVERIGSPVPNLAAGTNPVGMTDLVPARVNDPSIFVGSGSIASTAGDVARWLELLASGRVVDAKALESLLDFARLRGTFHDRFAIIASGWDGVGYAAHAIHVPDVDLTVVVLANVNISSLPGEIARGVAALALGETPLPPPLALRPLPVDSLERLVGIYRFGPDFYVPGGTLQIVARAGGLHDVGREPAIGLIPLAGGDFLYRSAWARVTFLRDAGGVVRGLRFDDRFEAVRVVP